MPQPASGPLCLGCLPAKRSTSFSLFLQEPLDQTSACDQAQGSAWDQAQGSACHQGQGSDCDQCQGSDCDQGQGSDCDQHQGSACDQAQGSELTRVRAQLVTRVGAQHGTRVRAPLLQLPGMASFPACLWGCLLRAVSVDPQVGQGVSLPGFPLTYAPLVSGRAD